MYGIVFGLGAGSITPLAGDPLLFAGIAIILGAIGTYQQKKGRGLSIAGLVLGGLALLISLGV